MTIYTPARPKPIRLHKHSVESLLEEHNAQMGTRYRLYALGLTRLTLWDGAELFYDAGTWFLRSAPAVAEVRA